MDDKICKRNKKHLQSEYQPNHIRPQKYQALNVQMRPQV